MSPRNDHRIDHRTDVKALQQLGIPTSRFTRSRYTRDGTSDQASAIILRHTQRKRTKADTQEFYVVQGWVVHRASKFRGTKCT